LLRRFAPHQATTSDALLQIPYTTVQSYLHLLYHISLLLSPLGPSALIYLAAAVSDFYIPRSEMAEHKIQSSGGGLDLKLDPVPKFLRPLAETWAPDAFVVSFKLETDDALLVPKAREALAKYGHQMVVANMLHTRKRTITLVTPEEEEEIVMGEKELKSGHEIEEKFVPAIVQAHAGWIKDLKVG
jgi:phosphopantothenate-cysteine ligase